MSEPRLHYSLDLTLDLLDGLFQAAMEASRISAKYAATHYRKSQPAVGLTLHPGDQTPLWNQLREQIRFHTQGYGDKANLARCMGLPRQRLQEFLKAGSAMPDAERTLWLLCWVNALEKGTKIES